MLEVFEKTVFIALFVVSVMLQCLIIVICLRFLEWKGRYTQFLAQTSELRTSLFHNHEALDRCVPQSWKQLERRHFLQLPSFLFSEPSDERDAVCRRVVHTAESTQRSFLLIAERLTWDLAVQRRRNASSQTALGRLIVLRRDATQHQRALRHVSDDIRRGENTDWRKKITLAITMSWKQVSKRFGKR